jgi:hypothetical protein
MIELITIQAIKTEQLFFHQFLFITLINPNFFISSDETYHHAH